jgi:hypothetical protein
MNLAGVAQLTATPMRGVWFRAIRVQFLVTPLAHAHTTTVPGRFTGGTPGRPGIAALYLAENGIVAQFEIQAFLGSPLPGQVYTPSPVQNTWVILPIEVNLTSVADLTRPPELQHLETSVQELTGDWMGYAIRPPQPTLASPYYSNVPTHRLGHALHAARRFEGLISYSASFPTQRNLIVFPARLRKGSIVRYTDPASNAVQQLPERVSRR